MRAVEFLPVSIAAGVTFSSIFILSLARSLESKDLILELADRARLLVAQALGRLLQAADHGRRTAEQDLDIVGRLGKVFLENESAAAQM